MKIKFYYFLFLIIFFNCSTKKEITKKDNTINASDLEYYKLEEGMVNWVGYKIVHQHHGTIQISQASITLKGDQLLEGEFIVDMKSLKNLDLSQQPKIQKTLENHLKSDDFFSVNNFPTSRFVISSTDKIKANKYNIKGFLTIKDTTLAINFRAEIFIQKDKTLKAASNSFKIDRTKWGILYASKDFGGFADKMIGDSIQLQINLTAKPIYK